MKKFEANNMDFIFDAVFNGAINLASNCESRNVILFLF